LVNVLEWRPKPIGQEAVTYHDPCHLKRGIGVSSEPRELLTAAGFNLREMAESDTCCGFAGTYSFKYPDISASVLARKLDHIASSDATVVATDCPGCILQIAGGLHRAGSRIRVRHTAELLRMP